MDNTTYRLDLGAYRQPTDASEDAGDSFSDYNGEAFSAFDVDGDPLDGVDCSALSGGVGGWQECNTLSLL